VWISTLSRVNERFKSKTLRVRRWNQSAMFDNEDVQVDALGTNGYDVLTRDGFHQLYHAALPVVFATMMRLTGGDRPSSEDLTQDAFGELLKAMRAGTLARADVGWLVTTARRRYIDRVRRSVVEQRILALVTGESDESDEPNWERFDGPDLAELCRSLPADQRLALILRHVESMSVPAIATEMNRTIPSIESLLTRARRTLRNAAKENT
jgi:RNA polymerase sigma-70 factor, ECF subfamily